ncbi:MAG: UDP-3-O-acyl-N-acetylglucosamine deacetylase [Planctomycetota bacterium]
MPPTRSQNPDRPQRTLARPAIVAGHGYWSSERVVVEFRPAAVGAGIAFVRDDLDGAPRIPAAVAHQRPADRRTILASGNGGQSTAEVEMVEHVLAALYGLGVDNCEVGVSAAEMPGCDGSSLAFVEAIADAGLVEQHKSIEPLVVTTPVRCQRGDAWIEARPPIGDGLSIEYNLDFGPDSPIPAQWSVTSIDQVAFATELAPARTFVLKAEADAIRAQGIAEHVTANDLLIFGPDGPIDNALRYPDECARHKALDVVGDFALAGRPIAGHIVACRSGHRLNAELVRELLATNADHAGEDAPGQSTPPQADPQQERRRSA